MGCAVFSIQKINRLAVRLRLTPIRVTCRSLKRRNAVVLGVSIDTAESHKSFCTQDGLSFKLLADPQRRVASEYGVPEMKFNGTQYDERDTILIAPNGTIARVWRKVDPQKDSMLVLAEIAKLQGR